MCLFLRYRFALNVGRSCARVRAPYQSHCTSAGLVTEDFWSSDYLGKQKPADFSKCEGAFSLCNQLKICVVKPWHYVTVVSQHSLYPVVSAFTADSCLSRFYLQGHATTMLRTSTICLCVSSWRSSLLHPPPFKIFRREPCVLFTNSMCYNVTLQLLTLGLGF